MKRKAIILVIVALILSATMVTTSGVVPDIIDICATEGHLWNTGAPYQAATCTQKGATLYECTREGCVAHQILEDIPPAEHSYVEKTLRPISCGSNTCGITIMVCKVCGYEDPASLRSYEIPPHKWTSGDEWIVWTKATCTSKGMKYRKCSECGYVENASIPMLSHSFTGDLTIKKAASCIVNGVMEGTCSLCNKKVSVNTGYTDHNWKVQEIGSTIKTRTCTVCKRSQYLDAYNGGWVTSINGLSSADNTAALTNPVCVNGTNPAVTAIPTEHTIANGTFVATTNASGISIPATNDLTGPLAFVLIAVALIGLGTVLFRIKKHS